MVCPQPPFLDLAARPTRLTRTDAFCFHSLLCVVRVAFSGECARFSAGPDVRLFLRRASSHLRHRPVRLPPVARVTRNRQIGRTPLMRLRFVPYSVCRPRRTARRFQVPGHPASALGRRPTPTCHRSPSPMRFFVRLARLRCFRVELMETRRPRHVIRGCRSFQRTYRTADRGPFSRLGREACALPATLMGLS